MFGNIQAPPAPTEEQALDFMTEKLRAGENMGRNNYDNHSGQPRPRQSKGGGHGKTQQDRGPLRAKLGRR
jgi:hypothetical protein